MAGKRPAKPQAYRDTSVPAMRTRGDIIELLRKYGCDAYADQLINDGQRGHYVLRFRYEERAYRMVISLGETPRDERQRMRAFYWSLKGIIEAAVFGMLKWEDLLLAYAEIPAPDGTTVTVGEHIRAQVDAHEVPSLLAPVPALPAPGDSA